MNEYLKKLYFKRFLTFFVKNQYMFQESLVLLVTE